MQLYFLFQVEDMGHTKYSHEQIVTNIGFIYDHTGKSQWENHLFFNGVMEVWWEELGLNQQTSG